MLAFNLLYFGCKSGHALNASLHGFNERCLKLFVVIAADFKLSEYLLIRACLDFLVGSFLGTDSKLVTIFQSNFSVSWIPKLLINA